MSNTWGALSWGQGSWAAQGDVGLTLSSVSASFSIGNPTVTGVIEIGWGGDTWGENAWGELSGAYVDVTGIALTSNLGSIITEADANITASSLSATSSIGNSNTDISLDLAVTGIELTSSIGQAVAGFGVEQTGIQATSSISSVTIDDRFLIGEGWGRDVWGGWAWGVNYSVALSGIQLTSVTGNEDAFTDVTVVLSGIELQSAITPVGTVANSDNEIAHSFLLTGSLGSPTITGLALVEPSGIAATTSIASVEAAPKQEIDVTGIQLTANLGNSDQLGNANISVTGIAATSAIGDVIPVSVYDATGSELTTSLGSVTITANADITPTGIGLTASIASTNIIAWAEVNTGTGVTWTDVDLAA
jgi:hypothetical protein